jgi:hypothetical protein
LSEIYRGARFVSQSDEPMASRGPLFSPRSYLLVFILDQYKVTLRASGWLAGTVWQLRFQSTRSARRGGEDGEGGGGAPGEDGVPDAGGVGAARSVLDGVAGTRFLSIFFFCSLF